MPLFDRKPVPHDEVVSGSDAATRALSVTAVENDFVEGVYDKLATVYDLVFGPTLHPGRLRAIQRMNIQPGERVLEVGVGTGINLPLYPKLCSVTGIDFSGSMLEKARERAARKDIRNMRLLQMDAADLKFADDSMGPFNMPLKVVAGMMDERGYPLVGEADISIVTDHR